jgi:hypothetical protein
MVRTVTAFLVAACLLLFAVEAAEAITGNEWKQLSSKPTLWVFLMHGTILDKQHYKRKTAT